MEDQKCLFSGSLKQTDVPSICQQVMRKLLLLQDIITYALLRRTLLFCGRDTSILRVVFPVVWETQLTESRVGRDPWRQPSPSPLFRQVSHSRSPWSVSSGAVSVSHDGDSTHTLGNLFQCRATLILKKKYAETEFRVFQLVQRREESGSVSFTLCHQILKQTGRISLEPSFLQAELPQLSLSLPIYQILLSPNHFCIPSVDSPVLGAWIWAQTLDVSPQR